MDIKCRVCLATTEAKMYHPLSTVFPEYMKTSLTVLDLLEVVTSISVNMSYSLPSSICTACLKQLKDSHNFIEQFKRSQSWLQENFSQELEAHQERITVKVEAIDDEFSSTVILDMDGNDIFQTGFLGEINKEYKETKIADLRKAVKKPRAKTTIKVKRTKKSGGKRNVAKPIKKNADGVIVMSIEDVLKEENELAEHNENSNNTSAQKSDSIVSEEETIIIHNDHTYQKNSETSYESNGNLFVMSIDDVLNSPIKIKSPKALFKRKRTKGIITQSTDLLRNLERKTQTRRAQKQNTEDKVGQAFICDVCQNVYESHRSLTAHKNAIHVPGWQEKFKCNICGLLCKTRSSYTHHKRKHKGKQVSCDECEKVYLTTTQLKVHKSRAHGDGIPAKYLCNECGKRFKYGNALQYHLVSKHSANDKPYMCRYCGFKCVQKSYIKRHERCHTDERPYKCKFCDRTFRGSAEMSSHQLTHGGKPRYNCTYCGKGFIQTWNMKVHWLQHKGDYDCEICNRCFIDENVLKFHYFHHHKIRDKGKEASEDTNSNDEQDNSDSFFYALNDDSFSQEIF